MTDSPYAANSPRQLELPRRREQSSVDNRSTVGLPLEKDIPYTYWSENISQSEVQQSKQNYTMLSFSHARRWYC